MISGSPAFSSQMCKCPDGIYFFLPGPFLFWIWELSVTREKGKNWTHSKLWNGAAIKQKPNTNKQNFPRCCLALFVGESDHQAIVPFPLLFHLISHALVLSIIFLSTVNHISSPKYFYLIVIPFNFHFLLFLSFNSVLLYPLKSTN